VIGLAAIDGTTIDFGVLNEGSSERGPAVLSHICVIGHAYAAAVYITAWEGPCVTYDISEVVVCIISLGMHHRLSFYERK
jgi:hypothetical protein